MSMRMQIWIMFRAGGSAGVGHYRSYLHRGDWCSTTDTGSQQERKNSCGSSLNLQLETCKVTLTAPRYVKIGRSLINLKLYWITFRFSRGHRAQNTCIRGKKSLKMMIRCSIQWLAIAYLMLMFQFSWTILSLSSSLGQVIVIFRTTKWFDFVISWSLAIMHQAHSRSPLKVLGS